MDWDWDSSDDDDDNLSSNDPFPDVHDLFAHYNSLYFDDALGHCIVYWTGSRSTRCPGMCHYLDGGFCEIRLSEPLLKDRSATDLKNILLHEMIHAFLYVRSKLRDHSYHGPSFKAMANAINNGFKTDPQKPSGGYNIILSHDFTKEVDGYRVQHWICESCGDMINGPGKPSAKDCSRTRGHEKSCSNLSCHWHRHRMRCSGRYIKTNESPGQKGKSRVPKDTQKNEGEKSIGVSYRSRPRKRSSQNCEQTKDLSIVKMPKMVDVVSMSSGIKSHSCDTLRSQRLMAIKLEDGAVAPRFPKKARTSVFTEKLEVNNWEKASFQSFGCHTDKEPGEESEEDSKPLVNKRTERRIENLPKPKRRFPDAEATYGGCSSQQVCLIDSDDEQPRPQTNLLGIRRKLIIN